MTFWIIVAFMGGILLIAVSYRPLQRFIREIELEKATELFSLQRERLEAKFVDLASSTGKPKGLKWEDCDFESEVGFARDKRNGQLSAFVGVSIKFSAVQGGVMEEVEAVHDRRHATALFHYYHGQWGTGGRVLFNMTPREAIEHFQSQYDPIAMHV